MLRIGIQGRAVRRPFPSTNRKTLRQKVTKQMKRILMQTATKTITLARQIVVEFPDESHPDAIDPKALNAVLEQADVDWDIDDEDFEFDTAEWADADDDADPDVIYEE